MALCVYDVWQLLGGYQKERGRETGRKGARGKRIKHQGFPIQRNKIGRMKQTKRKKEADEKLRGADENLGGLVAVKLEVGEFENGPSCFL